MYRSTFLLIPWNEHISFFLNRISRWDTRSIELSKRSAETFFQVDFAHILIKLADFSQLSLRWETTRLNPDTKNIIKWVASRQETNPEHQYLKSPSFQKRIRSTCISIRFGGKQSRCSINIVIQDNIYIYISLSHDKNIIITSYKYKNMFQSPNFGCVFSRNVGNQIFSPIFFDKNWTPPVSGSIHHTFCCPAIAGVIT